MSKGAESPGEGKDHELVMPPAGTSMVFSSFSQWCGVRSREGGLWDDLKLGFCQVGGAVGQGESQASKRVTTQVTLVINNGPKQVEDVRDMMEAMAGALKAWGSGSVAALRWRVGLVGVPVWEGCRHTVGNRTFNWR